MTYGELTRRGLAALLALCGVVAACRPANPAAAGGGTHGAPYAEAAVPSAPREVVAASEAAAPRLREPRTVCERFADRVAAFASASPRDTAAFLGALREEFVGGTDDPFELRAGLEEGRWNQAYFYAGHGGFRDEIDDAERYAGGGNHQPGHFVSVLLIAARFGTENARIAIAYAGDYDPGDEDDLRLSGYAIELGSGLADGSVPPAEVARRVAGFCR